MPDLDRALTALSPDLSSLAQTVADPAEPGSDALRPAQSESGPPCPACATGSTAYRFRKAGYRLFQCRDCRFLFVHPPPTPRQILEFYNTDYRHASPDFYPKAASRARRAFVKSLRFLRLARGRAVLDLGCGGGFMAAAFARLGARASGLDINEAAIEYARRRFPHCTFYCEPLQAFAARGLTFDLIFSSEVLEHLARPEEFMETLRAITRPGSQVYIATPDSGHPAVPADLAQWSDIQPPEHLQFFNRDNIERLFRRYGFALERSHAKRTPALSVLFARR